MYKYETHLHSNPVSRCASASVEESIDFYKELGYDGVFITNHFINGNINIDADAPYEDKINFYFSDFERGKEYGQKIGFKVFGGVEISCGGTDFLIYGLDKEWFLKNRDAENMKVKERLAYYTESGALVIQAHPYREASYIDHVRLFPRSVHGVEIINASRNEFENNMAKIYAKEYNLLEFAGSDNHSAANRERLAGVEFDTPLLDEEDFCKRVLENKHKIFEIEL